MYDTNEFDPNPSWKTIQGMTLGLCYQLTKSDFVPDAIIGIQRGGLIPATMLSHALDVPLVVVDYSSSVGKGDDKRKTVVDIGYPIFKNMVHLPKKILIVDDICDSGHTLNDLYAYFQRNFLFARTKTLTLFTKHGSVFTPDYYSFDLPEDAPFINFPWEVDYNFPEKSEPST